MSRPAKITVLCEDPQQGCFVRRFLMNRGWMRHDIYEKIHPSGKGSAEQWVRERFPTELRVYRSKCNHLRNGLIAVIDADALEVVDRIRGFDSACREQGVDIRRSDERIMLVVPKRNIETWLAFLAGETVDESIPYSTEKYDSRCHEYADQLDKFCRCGELPGHPPPSLKKCCDEFQNFWCLIQ